MKKIFTSTAIICIFLMLSIIAIGGKPSNSTISPRVAHGHIQFLENKGQIVDQNHNPNPAVKYLLCRPGFNVQLRQTGFSYDTYTDEATTASGGIYSSPYIKYIDNGATHHAYIRHYQRVDVELLNCNPQSEMIASGASSEFYNYANGSVKGGITDIHHYNQVTYKNIYSNIDLEFFTSSNSTGQNPVEYQFIVHPGGKVSDIQLCYKGQNHIDLENSQLMIQVAAGTFTENIPSSYFRASGKKINVDYVKSGENIFSFRINGGAEITSDLIIDPFPNLEWATYYGGGQDEIGAGIAVDPKNGNAFIAGWTVSSNNIATSGAYQTSLEGGTNGDAFVGKFDPTGSKLLWGTYYGGGIAYSSADFGSTGYVQGFAMAWGIALDDSENVYITGETSDSNGMATPGAYQTQFRTAGTVAFIAKFNSSGTLQWGTYYGNTYKPGQLNAGTHGKAIALDIDRNVYVTGTTSDNNGISTPGVFQTSYIGTTNVFVSKFNSSGSTLLWGTYYGSDRDFGTAITTDGNNEVYVTGCTGSITGISTPGAFKTSISGIGTNAFIAKFNSTGTKLDWGTYFGGNVTDFGQGIALNTSDDVFITGFTQSNTGIATPGAYQANYGGGTYNAYIAAFDPSGATQLFGTYFGGSGYAKGQCIKLDAAGGIYITGYTNTTMMSSANAYQVNDSGGFDAYVAKFSTTGTGGTKLDWSTYFGGTGDDEGYGVALDDSQHVYVAGSALSTTAIATTGAYQTYFDGGNGGWGDAFVARFFDSTASVSLGVGTAIPHPEQINVYPNPNRGQFTVSGLEIGMKVEVFDCVGRKIMTVTANNTSAPLNISNQSDGIYLLRILSKNGALIDQRKIVRVN